MSGLALHSVARAKCDEAIIITGAARSGTTIMGKLVHSLEGVECVHEPAMLYCLVSLIDKMDRRTWEVLYETYLYQEFLSASLAGRALNCNLEDDSSIYKVKDEEWIKRRLSHSVRLRDIEETVKCSRIAYKGPCLAPYVAHIQEYYPNTHVVMMLRDATEVLHSSLERQWFSDDMLRTQNLLGPGQYVDGIKIPFWVASKDFDLWVQWDELHRAAYYYVRAHQEIEKTPNIVMVKYDELILRPEHVVSDLRRALGLQFGPKTRELLGQIKKTEKPRDQQLIGRLTSEMREQVIYYSELSQVG